MIISASRRTDIPAFYSDWFYNRIRDGFVVTQNPFNANQLRKIDLDPGICDAIVFWTKNPEPMISRLDELDGFMYYFQFTLTPYDMSVEPGLPDKKALLGAFSRLSEKIGRKRVIWRYDPILISDEFPAERHIDQFGKLARILSGQTEKVVISFLDFYPSIMKRIAPLRAREIRNEEIARVSSAFSRIARENNMVVESCSEKIDLESFGIKHGKCVDGELIGELLGVPVDAGKDKNQRPDCGCVESIDIGAYNTCRHGCKYCYANFSEKATITNHGNHDPESPLLTGRNQFPGNKKDGLGE